MKPSGPSRVLYAVLAILLVLLPLLAVLQYRWIGEVSQADRQRREESLYRSGNAFANEFDRELTRVATNFQIRGSLDAPNLVTQLGERYDASSATDPSLVRRILIVRSQDSTLQLRQFDPKTATLQPIDWPVEFGLLRESLQARADRFGGRRQSQAALQSLAGMATVVAVPVVSDGEQRPGTGSFGRGARPGGPAPPAGWTIVEFDQKVLFDEFVPTLVARHITANSPEYRVAIVTRGAKPQVVYKSDPEFSQADMISPDLRIPLLGSTRQGRTDSGISQPLPGGMRGGPVLTASWELLVTHRMGSLDAAIISLRNRNLAISFGVLMVLASSVVLVVVFSQRTRALAQLQMDFVARVSHELRTPLAIIRSAAYNVATGVVSEEKDIREYALMMQTEGQRLSTMVDQILTFSRTESGHVTYDLRPVRVADIVERVIDTMSAALNQSGCEIDRDIAGNLPKIKADETALAECLQNLLSNAIKYGRSGPRTRIQIEARRGDTNTVLISVADSGAGIDFPDLPHIFEPFFRGRNARSDAPGSGLGLDLVSRLMNAQGGRVTVESEPGRGARFTLHVTAIIEAVS